MSSPTPHQCRLCRVVPVICFWGPRPEKRWKRPGLFAASVLITLLGAVVFAPNLPAAIVLYALFGFILAVGIFGIVVSVFGCNACVARTFGDSFSFGDPF